MTASWEGAGWYDHDGRWVAECTSDLVSDRPFARTVAERILFRDAVEGLADILRQEPDLHSLMVEEVDDLAFHGGDVVMDDDPAIYYWWEDRAEFWIWVEEALGQEAARCTGS